MLNFPSNPSVNQTYTVGSDTWYWNGTTWEVRPQSSPSFVNLTVSGTITGQVSSVANHNLTDLGNVDASSPLNAQVLAYNDFSDTWEATTLSSSFTGGSVPNAITITNTAEAGSINSGALIVDGGAGIAKNLHVGGNIILDTTALELITRAELRFSDSDNSNYISFKSPLHITSNVNFILPDADGTSGQVLSTNGSGTLSWITPAGGGEGGTTPPGGSNTYIQYNNNNTFGGSSSLTFNSGTLTLGAPIIAATGAISTTDTTASTTTTTGSIKAAGGVGVAGQLNVGGVTNKFTNTTASTSTTTGTLVVAGGVGVAGDIYVGSIVNSPVAPTISTHLTNKQYVDSNVLAFSMAFGV